ncbi:PepSY-associated TM helix domain-containing protein [Mucilaginibacter sp. CAU 1740]|uniref:PepSY-associated TM helix domain-containing protein n=1 Tax=Mucilaginibacter sp. CAU 1740 TaxID=3140365 RepID=UPI00325B944E
MRSNFKKGIRLLHRWLGLSSGLVVFILGLTGCIYAFAPELKEWCCRDRFYVPHPGPVTLPLDQLREAAQSAIDSRHTITRAQLFKDKRRTWQFRALKIDPAAFGYSRYYTYYDLVYVDPYTAKVIHVENGKNDFFTVVLAMHLNLLLGKPIGQQVIRVSVIIFLVLLISGIILWWPKTWKKKQLSNNLSISWNAGFKRLIYDLHNVPGFYSLLILLLIALTGLMMSYGLNGITIKPVSSDTTQSVSKASIKTALGKIIKKGERSAPGAGYLYLNYPAGPEGTYTLTAYFDPSHLYDRQQFRYDQYTGTELDRSPKFGQLGTADQFRTLQYDLHTGSAIGMTGRILAFLASLVATSLPLTGLFIWMEMEDTKSTGGDKQDKAWSSRISA